MLIVGALSGEFAQLRRSLDIEGVRHRPALSHHLRIAARLHVVHPAARQGLTGETGNLCVRESARRGPAWMGDRGRAVVNSHRHRRSDRHLRGGSNNNSAEHGVDSGELVSGPVISALRSKKFPDCSKGRRVGGGDSELCAAR